jgi:hypothetical protein
LAYWGTGQREYNSVFEILDSLFVIDILCF